LQEASDLDDDFVVSLENLGKNNSDLISNNHLSGEILDLFEDLREMADSTIR